MPVPTNGSTNGTFQQTLDGLSKDPLRRTWRGNKQGALTRLRLSCTIDSTLATGTIELERCPKFDNLYEEREWIKVCQAILRFWAVISHLTFPIGSYGCCIPVLGQIRLW